MNTVVNVTLEGIYLELPGVFWNPDDWVGIIRRGDNAPQIMVDSTAGDPINYCIKWENCTNEYFEYDDKIGSSVIHLEVIDESKPVTFSYSHGDEFIDKIELDPLNNNGVTIAGTDSAFICQTHYRDSFNPQFGDLLDYIHYLSFGDLNDINSIIHVNEIAII